MDVVWISKRENNNVEIYRSSALC